MTQNSKELTMSNETIPVSFDRLRSRVVVGDSDDGRAHVLHCSYYNCYLLRTIWKDMGQFIDSTSILIGAAAEQAYFQLKGLFEAYAIVQKEERKRFAAQFYSWQGLGVLDLNPIEASGGVSLSVSQHYAEGWKEQFGLSSEPVGFMTRGWLAGAASAIHDRPHGYYSTHQLECGAVTGGTDSVFELRPDGANYAIFDDKRIKPASRTVDLINELTGHVDADAVAKAVATLNLFGAENRDKGLIKNFDVLITWQPHQYYDRISLECVRQATEKFGREGRDAVEPLLEEAGHRCAFRTFGGIWKSPEWEAIVEPMCNTREDWIHGLIAIINCAGWGRVQCEALSSERAVLVVHCDYESVGCLNIYGQSDFPPIYLLKGGFRGMMNLVYNENIMGKPALTEELYDRMCRRQDAYEATVETCLAMGDRASVLTVKRLMC